LIADSQPGGRYLHRCCITLLRSWTYRGMTYHGLPPVVTHIRPRRGLSI